MGELLNKDEPKPKTVTKYGRDYWKRNRRGEPCKVGIEDGTDSGPNTLPDGTPLLTKAELMELEFEVAGRPTKGSQPKDDFKPSIR